MLPRRQPSFAHTTTCTPDAPLKQYRYILLLGFILFFLSFINVIYVLTLPDVEADVHSHDIVVTKAPPRDNVLVQTYDRASAERAAQREATDADVAPISWLGADYEFANAHPTYANPIRTDFPTFEEYIGESGRLFRSSNALRPKLRVCFATFAVVGPIKNGGIATADTALAEELVAAGHAVSILYLWGTGTQNKKIGYWIEYYRKKQITLIPLKTSLPKLSSSSPSKYIRKAYQTYSWLRDHEADFDILHFHEWHGPGYYVSLAKHQGLAFQKTMLVTTIHCPALFYLAGNQGHLTSYNNFVSDYLERTQVMYSDLVISPSK